MQHFNENAARGRRSVFEGTWPQDTLGDANAGMCAWSVRVGVGIASALGGHWKQPSNATSVEESAANWLGRTNWWCQPLRMGLVEPGDWSIGLCAAQSAADARWLSVPSSDAELNPSEIRANGCCLDATVRPTSHSELLVTTAEMPGREAAWYDWSIDRPLSYPAVFPTRLDCGRISIQRFAFADSQLLLRLIEAAAIWSRHPARLSFADRTWGRLPTVAERVMTSSTRPVPYIPNGQSAHAILSVLTSEISLPAASGQRPTPVVAAAARLCGAWLATTTMTIDDEFRRAGVESVARLIGDEPEAMLRIASVRLGTLDDDAGLDAILRADRMLRDRQLLPSIDHTAFVQAELEHGAPSPMTVGRLAAGICMVTSTMPASRIKFYFNDLLDDMRFATLLVGRDQDHALLERVCRELERARRTECYALPPAPLAAPGTEERRTARKPRKRRKAA